MQRYLTTAIVTVVLAACCSALWAAEPNAADMARTIAQLQKRVDQLEVESSAQAHQETVMKILKEMNADAAKRSAMPAWMENLKFFGDLRLRYQAECYSGDRDWNMFVGGNSGRKTRNRVRFRLRFGIKKTWLDDQMEVGFRIATGEQGYGFQEQHEGPPGLDTQNDSDPTDTNQTMTTGFSQKRIWLDRAYAMYKPNWLKGFMIIGGKFGIPWVHTDLTWDSDVNPEGFYAQYKHTIPGLDAMTAWAGIGYFILEEIDDRNPTSWIGGYDHDSVLHLYQVGLEYKFTKEIKALVALTYMDFNNYDQLARLPGTEFNDVNNITYPAFWTLAAKEFDILNLTTKVGWKAFGLKMGAYFDWVHNCSDNDPDRDDYDDQADGYAVSFKVGENEKKGDWSVFYKYAYIEANCTPAQFNDVDFGRTNTKGHLFGGAYNITDFMLARVGVFHTAPVVGYAENERTTTIQCDLVWNF